MQAKGFKGRLVFDYESSFGVSPSTKKGSVLAYNTLEVTGKQTLITPATIRNSRHQAQPAKGNTSVDGSVQIPFDISQIGYILKGLFGAPTTVSAGSTYATSYKKHTFIPAAEQPSMVIEKGFTDLGQYYLYNGCKLSKFKLPFGGDGELVATVDIMGSQETVSANAYVPTPVTLPFDRLNNFQSTIKENGTVLGIVSKGEINIDMGLDGNQYTIGGGGVRGAIPEGLVAVTGSLTVLFTDMNLLKKAFDGTTTSLELSYITKGLTTDLNKKLTIEVPELVFERTSPTITGPAGVSVDLNWQAFYNTGTDATSIKIELINDIEKY